MADSIISKLVIQLLFDSKKAKSQLSEGEKMVANFATKAVKLFLAIGAVDFATNIVKQFTQTTSELGFLSKTLGQSSSSMDEMEQAVKRMGGTTQGAASSLEGLADRINEALVMNAGPAVKIFNQLGIQARFTKTGAIDLKSIVIQLSDAFSGMSQEMRQTFGHALGLNDAFIRMLALGPQGVQSLFAHVKALGVISEAQARAAERAKMQMADLQQSFRNAKNALAETLLPIYTTIEVATTKFVNFLTRHFELVKTIGAGAFAALVAAMVPVLGALGPIPIAIGAITTAIVFVVTHFKQLKETAVAVGKVVLDSFTSIPKEVKTLWEDLIHWFSRTSIGKAITKTFSDITDDFRGALNDIEGFFSSLFGDSSNSAVNKATKNVHKLNKKALEARVNTLLANAPYTQQQLAGVSQMRTANAVANNQNRVNTTININGYNKDPKQLADEVNSRLHKNSTTKVQTVNTEQIK